MGSASASASRSAHEIVDALGRCILSCALLWEFQKAPSNITPLLIVGFLFGEMFKS